MVLKLQLLICIFICCLIQTKLTKRKGFGLLGEDYYLVLIGVERANSEFFLERSYPSLYVVYEVEAVVISKFLFMGLREINR